MSASTASAPQFNCAGPTPLHVTASITSTATDGRSAVDASTTADLHWGNDRSARIRCSFVDDEEQRLELVGTDGALLLDADAHTGGMAASKILYRSTDGTTTEIDVAPGDPYLGMIDAFASAVAGEKAWERTIDDSLDMLRLIERILETA